MLKKIKTLRPILLYISIAAEAVIHDYYGSGNYKICMTVQVDNERHATFAKFDVNNNLVWQRQFDNPSKTFDFVKADNDFLLVGRTEPASFFGTPLGTKSILAKIDDQGNKIFIREYNNAGRETFTRIVKHPNPLNSTFPYYVSSLENAGINPSYSDVVFLHNICYGKA